MAAYDLIAVGVGGVGSAALYHAARRGLRVLGIDRFPPGHDRGSSHGGTRAIRMAYFEHPDYVPLLRRAYQLWEELEHERRQRLFERVGLLQVGPPNGLVVPGVLKSATEHRLPVEQLDEAELVRRFPGFRVPTECVAVYEANAGYLLVEDCVRAHAELAVHCGAELAIGQIVREIHFRGGDFLVVTDQEQLHSRYLIVTPGPWADQLLAPLALPLKVLIKYQYWYPSSESWYQRHSGCPVYFFEIKDEFFYGFPQYDSRGVKVARHTGGQPCDDPLAIHQEDDPEDRQLVEQFLAECLPGVARPVNAQSICFYTMTPDGHFIVERLPDTECGVFVAGLSGHGFKFTSVLGQAMVDWCVSGKEWPELRFLRRDRFDS